MQNLKITQQDIADALNISRATVSKVFNGKPTPAKVREAVLKKAVDLGYFDSESNQISPIIEKNPNMKSKLEGLVLLVCFPHSQSIQNSTADSYMSEGWQRIIKGMESACEILGYNLIVSVMADEDKSIFQLLEHYTMTKVDGIILMGDYTRSSIFLQANKKDLPIVFTDTVNLQYSNCENQDVIVFDIVSAINSILRHFVEQGHTEIAYVGDVNNKNLMSEHRIGFLYACREKSINAGASNIDLDLRGGNLYEQLKNICSSLERLPTAYICENDEIAVELTKVLTNLGHKVPEEIGVAGFGSNDISVAQKNRFITTVFEWEELGFKAVEQIITRILYPQKAFLTIRLRLKIIL